MKKFIQKHKPKLVKSGIILGILLLALSAIHVNVISESEIKENVVKLTGARGLCSGEQVIAASGKTYILTAAHCKGLATDGSILVHTEDGRHLNRRIIMEDDRSDLLLLEGVPGLSGLSIASSLDRWEHERTYTHGRGFDTYRTDGMNVQDKQQVAFILGEPSTCLNMPKYRIVEMGSFFGITFQVCIMEMNESVTTAKIVPGSSGGPVVNDSGQLVGVASAGDNDGAFGYLVRLQDIQLFLSNF